MKDWVYSLWRNGTYVDLWSVNHLLAGALFGFAFSYYTVPLAVGLGLAALAMIGWEVFEILYGINETWQNRVMDVVVGIAGFVGVWFMFPLLSPPTALFLFLAVLVVWAMLELWGRAAYVRGKTR